jgi:hypothetical protein
MRQRVHPRTMNTSSVHMQGARNIDHAERKKRLDTYPLKVLQDSNLLPGWGGGGHRLFVEPHPPGGTAITQITLPELARQYRSDSSIGVFQDPLRSRRAQKQKTAEAPVQA